MPSVRKPKVNGQKAPTAAKPKPDLDTKPTVISGQLKKKINKRKQQQSKVERGVVLVKHLPHGFFEEQLRKYFQQFGHVTRLRLARSTRTGGSRGFAFVEFEYQEVAKVAAETMHNYLMFKKVIKAAYIPPSEQKFNYFKSTVRKVKNKAGKPMYISAKTSSIQRRVKEQNNWTDDAYQKRIDGSVKKLKRLQKKYAHLDFDFSNVLLGGSISDKGSDKTKEAATKDITNKRKLEKVTTTAGADTKQKKSKKEINLEDLLGNTINDDDSEDENYSLPEYSDGDTDDDSYISDQNLSYDSDSEEEEKIIVKPVIPKMAKATKVDRFEQLIKRKPHTGGIQKQNKKPNKKTPAPTATAAKSLKIAAAKEVAKPLSHKPYKFEKSITIKKGKESKK